MPILQIPEESKGPAEESDSAALRSSRSLCYIVAWFDGKVERFQSETFAQLSQATTYYQ